MAYWCVRMVAEAAASVPFLTTHEAAARLIRQPVPEMPGPVFLEGVYSQLQLHGNAFVEAVQLPGEEDGIAAFYALRDERGWSPVLHLKLFHPENDLLGLPALAPARRALDLHNASAGRAKALIDNSAKLSGALIWSGHGRMPPEQFDRLKADLDALYSRAANASPAPAAGRRARLAAHVAVAGGHGFLAARNSAAREIALCAGRAVATARHSG